MRSPYLHALMASLYILTIALFFNYANNFLPTGTHTILAPMILLSLLVLSVTVMGYLFFYQPLTLYMAGKRSDAFTFFARTVATFALLTVAVVGMLVFGSRTPLVANDPQDATYLIDGQHVQLVHGVSEVEVMPGSASRITTRYFGNELHIDLNGDGREDVVFLVTQDTGGSGLFYYVVAALNTPNGYVGSDGYLLGDRVAPQSTSVSQNPKQTGVVVVNYADRALGQPMSAQPSVGKSVYLKLDTDTMQWGVVEPNFEGEAGH